jgi:hypothetical protein
MRYVLEKPSVVNLESAGVYFKFRENAPVSCELRGFPKTYQLYLETIPLHP